MPPVDRLPPERVRHTLHLDAISLRIDYPSVQRNALLRNASLACRSWRVHAQDELWDLIFWDLISLDTSKANAFVAASSIGRLTRTLEFVGGREHPWSLTWREVARVLAAVRSVRDLELSNIHDLTMENLLSPSLNDLHTLTLGDRLGCATNHAPPRSFSFQLSHLNVIYSYRMPIVILSTLLQQPSITSLHLRLHPDLEDVDEEEAENVRLLCSALLSTAPHLLSLDIVWRESSDPSPANASITTPLLEACTSLLLFKSDIADASQLKHIPAALESWTVYDFAGEAELLTILRNTPAHSKLRLLRMEPPKFYFDELMEDFPPGGIGQECERRGIIFEIRQDQR